MQAVEIIGFRVGRTRKIPLFLVSACAGDGNPSGSDVESFVDLNEFLVDHPASTFFARVKGDSLDELGIRDDDVLIVDSSIDPVDGKFVLIYLKNELTVKVYRNIRGKEYLQSANNQFVPLKVGSMNFDVLGVVTKVIHSI